MKIDPKNCVIVNDGSYEWAAETAKLLDTLKAHGWTLELYLNSTRYIEPPRRDDDDCGEAYNALCYEVYSVAGEGSAVEITDKFRSRIGGRFCYRPDLGEGAWVMSQ